MKTIGHLRKTSTGGVFLSLLSLALCGVAFGSKPPAGKAKPKPVAPVDFARDVRPILTDKCFACHGKDDKKRQANLRLDMRESAISRAASGRAAIVPGKLERSSLVERITTKTPLQMPPVQTGKKLTEAEKDTLRRWIAQGAKYVPHWAFVKPIRPVVPKVANTALVRNPIDNFVRTASMRPPAVCQPATSVDHRKVAPLS